MEKFLGMRVTKSISMLLPDGTIIEDIPLEFEMTKKGLEEMKKLWSKIPKEKNKRS